MITREERIVVRPNTQMDSGSSSMEVELVDFFDGNPLYKISLNDKLIPRSKIYLSLQELIDLTVELKSQSQRLSTAKKKEDP